MRQKFNLDAEMEKALAWVLDEMASAYNRSEDTDDPQLPNGHGRTWLAGRPHFSATDLERRVRAAAAEALHNLPYGSQGIDSYYPVRISTGGRHESLLGACRSFLARQPGLRADQPSGRHTCSGLRFRPTDAPLTEAEQQTRAIPQEERARRGWIRHYQPGRAEDDYQGKKQPLCQQNKKPTGHYHRRRKPVHVTGNLEKVTCKTCQKMAKTAVQKAVAAINPAVAKSLATGDFPFDIAVRDWLPEHGMHDFAPVVRPPVHDNTDEDQDEQLEATAKVMVEAAEAKIEGNFLRK
jgi:hypothetical protein